MAGLCIAPNCAPTISLLLGLAGCTPCGPGYMHASCFALSMWLQGRNITGAGFWGYTDVALTWRPRQTGGGGGSGGDGVAVAAIAVPVAVGGALLIAGGFARKSGCKNGLAQKERRARMQGRVCEMGCWRKASRQCGSTQRAATAALKCRTAAAVWHRAVSIPAVLARLAAFDSPISQPVCPLSRGCSQLCKVHHVPPYVTRNSRAADPSCAGNHWSFPGVVGLAFWIRRRNDKASAAAPPAKDAETGDVPVVVKSGPAEAGSDGRGDSGAGFLGPAPNSTTVLSHANSVLSGSVPTEGVVRARGDGIFTRGGRA